MAIINSLPMYSSKIPDGGSPFLLAEPGANPGGSFGITYRTDYSSEKGNVIYAYPVWGTDWAGIAIIPIVSFTADVNNERRNPVNITFEAGKRYELKTRHDPDEWYISYYYFRIENTTDDVTVCSYQDDYNVQWLNENFMYNITIL